MNVKFIRLLSLTMVMFTMFSMSAFAGSSTYYSKVIANAVGGGKVYASSTSTNSPTYAEGSSAATNNSSAMSAPTHTFYLYAQANEGYEFVGWYDNANCTGDAVATTATYTVKFTVNSTAEDNPTTQTYYAKFMKTGAPTLEYGNSHVYVNVSDGTYKNESLTTQNVTEAITYESSNENVATVAADGTVTVKKNGSCIIKAKSGEGEGSYILTVIDDAAAGVTQIGNGDFENWSGATSSNHAPNNWNSFETGEGTYASLSSAQQVDKVEGGRPGSDGLYCVDIWSRSVVGVIAQGTLTTGCINAGAMSATDKNNNSFSKIEDSSKSETLSRIPSAIKMWVKFVPAKANAAHPNAHVAATVHDAHNYVTYSSADYDDDDNKSYAIAHANMDFPACDWTEITIPFEPTGNTTDGQMYILLNISTNADPGQGQAGDHLYVDDIELVYPEPVVYDKYIGITVNGVQNAPVAAPIEVTYNNYNTIDFNLKNFALDLGGGYANVGNVTVPNLPIDTEGNFSFNGTIQITAGDKEGVDPAAWIGPGMGDIPLVMTGTITDEYFYVHLDINVGYPVEVEVGDLAEATFKVGDALIGTFCAPFTVVIPEAYQSFVTVSTITGVGEKDVLTLEPITDGVVPAHTPVIVEIPQAFEMPVSGIYVKGTPTVGLLTGVYENTPAPLGSYVLQSINDVVGFYQVGQAQPTVKANRCYLTVPDSNVKAFYFNEDDATGIENLNNQNTLNSQNTPIYNLAGQRVNKMQRGINIINGKKILK